jgi:GNAT superfamily N-acetyltransferase
MAERPMLSTATIRRARLDEAALLTALTVRAEEAWGYDADFMAWADEAFTVTPAYIAAMPVYVLDHAGEVVGFYGFRGSVPELDLNYLMVEPARQRTGCGTRLWRHAVATARQLGATTLTIDSDPHAEAFYRAMGATTVGEGPRHAPGLPDWYLRKMRFLL